MVYRALTHGADMERRVAVGVGHPPTFRVDEVGGTHAAPRVHLTRIDAVERPWTRGGLAPAAWPPSRCCLLCRRAPGGVAAARLIDRPRWGLLAPAPKPGALAVRRGLGGRVRSIDPRGCIRTGGRIGTDRHIMTDRHVRTGGVRRGVRRFGRPRDTHGARHW